MRVPHPSHTRTGGRNGLRGMLLRVAILATAISTVSGQAAATSSDARCPHAATAGPAVEAIRALELRGARANVDGWSIEEARSFFAPDFVSIQPDGSVTRLDKVLTAFADGRNAGFARSFDITELEIRVYGCNAAIVIGAADIRARAAPPDAPAWRVRFLNIWRRDGERWRLTANQFARIPPDPYQDLEP